jgi:hypothetical protein
MQTIARVPGGALVVQGHCCHDDSDKDTLFLLAKRSSVTKFNPFRSFRDRGMIEHPFDA